jgi:hypothetical protein
MSAQLALYQAQTSQQSLAQGLEEYYATNPHLKRGTQLSDEARDFFRSHDVAHVLYGCGVSLPHEAVVKLSSLFGTTGGMSVVRGYLLHESLDIYRKLPVGDTLLALAVAPYLVIRTIWRCARQQARWPWTGHESFMDMPLCEIRSRFGIKVVQAVEHRQVSLPS